MRDVLDELGPNYERREEITTPTSESRARSTPTLQVPTFPDGDVQLGESGLKIEYLLSKCAVGRDGEPLPWPGH